MPRPLILESSEVVTLDAPVAATSLTIVPLHIVSPSVPIPTLDHGRPV